MGSTEDSAAQLATIRERLAKFKQGGSSSGGAAPVAAPPTGLVRPGTVAAHHAMESASGTGFKSVDVEEIKAKLARLKG
ncbi:MAG: hypothetical protein ACK40L_19425 [Hydrogenophaga sp.]